MQHLHSPKKGFTLIETLFAILIFSAALISLLAISSKGISATNQIKNETTAYYLAQEGLETVRAARDENFRAATAGISGRTWTDGFASPGGADCTGIMGCFIDYAAGPALAQNTSSGGTPDIFLTADGRYANTGITPTGFSRTIIVSPVSPDEFSVTSEVFWKAKSISRSVKLQTFIKKWQY